MKTGARQCVAWLLPCCVVTATCNGAVDPSSLSERVLVGGGESARFYLVDGRAGKIVSSSEPAPPYRDALALSPDSATLYITAFGQEGGNSQELIALDTRSLRFVWRERLVDLAGRSGIGELRIWGTYTLAVLPGGNLLALDGMRGDTVGLIIVDLQSRSPVGFVGPLVSGQHVTAAIPADSPDGSGTLLVGGTRVGHKEQKSGYVFVLEEGTLAIRDSVAVTRTVDERGGIAQVLPSPDGRHIYIVALDSLYKLDRVARRMVASAPRPVPYRRARLAIAPDGQSLYMTDPGDGRDYAGSGRLFAFGPNLELRDPVDLRNAANIVVTHTAAVSLDGSLVYVTFGTPSVGPAYGFEPSRLLVLDARAATLVRSIPLDDWGVREVFVY